MRRIPLFVLAGCAGGSTATRPAPGPSEGPELAVRRYFRASDEGAPDVLREATHASIWMQSAGPAGELRVVPQLTWTQRLVEKPPVPAASRTLEVIDREGGLALVRATSKWPERGFEDLIVVARDGARWQMIAKIFTAAPDPQELTDADKADIAAVVADKVAAHAAYDPSLLARSHTEDCPYYRIDPQLVRSSLSEAAAQYAAKRATGRTSASPWRTLLVTGRGTIAAAKLEVQHEGTRYIDYLLLLRLQQGWRIVAAAWGDPR
jgi:hypothetical protein